MFIDKFSPLSMALLCLLLAISAFSLSNGQSQDKICTLGLLKNETNTNYGMASGLVHIFTWMKVECDGQITEVSFINQQSVVNNQSPTRFYLAAFEEILVFSPGFRLVNFVAIELQTLANGWQTVTLPDARAFYVKSGQFLGYFYDKWDTFQSSLIIPYRLGTNSIENAKYLTYVGFQDKTDLSNSRELKRGSQLQADPAARLVPLNVKIVSKTPNITTCGNPPTIANGRIDTRSSNGAFLYQDYVVYSCLDGYSLEGSSIAECLRDGTWSTLPICMASCGAAPSIRNARIVQKSFERVSRVGSTVDYACDTASNYQLADGYVSRMICESQSQWSRAPLCVSNSSVTNAPGSTTKKPPTDNSTNQVTCGAPPVINRAVEVSRSFSENKSVALSEVRYRCQTGYTLGSDTGLVICGYDGIWGPTPSCVLAGSTNATTTANPNTGGATCSSPPILVNGDIVGSSFQLSNIPKSGDSLTYACNQGYKLTDSNSGQVIETKVVKCLDNGNWETLPQCVSDPNNPNGQQSCGRPPTLINGRVVRNSDDGLEVIYACEPGFSIFGASVVVCTNGQWSQMPSCEVTVVATTQPTPTISPNLTTICGYPPVVRNSKIIGLIDIYPNAEGGEQLTYACDSLYFLQGTAIVTCLDSPRGWTAIPQCRPLLSCGSAPVVENAEIVGQNFQNATSRNGSYVQYSCLGAYSFIGGIDSVRCNGLSGTWTQLPVCSFQTCGQPPLVENALVQSQSFSGIASKAGSYVTYQCRTDTGTFRMVGSNTVSCDGSTFKWTATPRCVGTADSCGLPPGVKNGAITVTSVNTSSRFGDFVFYACDTGYSMLGNNYVECINQSWSRPPQCVSSCGSSPPPVANAEVFSKTFSTIANVGDSATYRCLPGYFFVNGSVAEVTCLPTMSWSTPLPQCGENPTQAFPPPIDPLTPKNYLCGKPPTIANAVIVAQYDNAVRYQCTEQYTINEADTSACQSDLFWSPIPECVRSCGDPPTVANARIAWKSFNTSKSRPTNVVRYSCNGGQPIVGSDSVICGTDGRWSKVPSCVTCGLPPVVQNARVDYQNFESDASQPGSVARYVCQLAMEIRGTDTVICGSDGKWSAAPICSPNSCGPPPAVPNGVITSKSFNGTNGGPNDRVLYNCRTDIGYFVLKGNRTIACNFERLEWSTPPTCEGAVDACGPVQQLENGIVAASSVVSGAFARSNDFAFYSCNVGFVLSGVDLVECSNGRWTTMPTCIESCGINGPGIPNAAVTRKTFRNYAGIGDSVQYTCLSGYKLSPDSQALITCQSNWRWSKLPVCVNETVPATPTPAPVRNLVSKCGSVPVVENGFVTKQSFADNITTFIDSIEYTCNGTYRMLGLNIVFCQENNQWSTPPQCLSLVQLSTTTTAKPQQILACQQPPQLITNGRLLTRTFDSVANVGSNVTYKCDVNYVLSGQKDVICESSGQWSVLPNCIRDQRGVDSRSPACTFPPTVANARMHYTTMGISGQLELGVNIIYRCLQGYEIVGNPLIWCQGSVQAVEWTNPPSCKESQVTPGFCGKAPEVSNSDKVRFDYKNLDFGTFAASPGDKVYYRCREGYVLLSDNGDSAALCSQGPAIQWTNIPRCSNRTCGATPVVSNGRVAAAVFNSGNERYGGPSDTLYYTCDSGYSMKGPETVTCTGPNENPKWTQVPECVIADLLRQPFNIDPQPLTPRPSVDNCPKVPNVTNAYIVSAISPNEISYPIGTIIQYKCNTGFVLDIQSIDSIICGPKGWSDAPLCRRQVGSINFSPCSAPPQVSNGFIMDVNGYIVIYTCNLGYAFSSSGPGNDRVQCQRSSDGRVGEWTQPPKCVPAGCGPVPSIENARLSVKTFDISSIPQDKAFFQCEPGFQVKNSAYIVITCQQNGSWSQGGICEMVDGLQAIPVTPANLKENCGATPTIENARIIYTQYLSGSPTHGGLGDTIFYTCIDGYSMVGDRQVVCSSSPLKWTKLPECVKASPCAVIPVVTSGYIVDQSSPDRVPNVGDTVTFQCADGWQLTGSELVTCTSNGWSLAPRCVFRGATTCGIAPSIPNGVVVYSDFENQLSRIGSRAFYRCNDGYILTTVPSSVICLENGQWSAPPTCLQSSSVPQSKCAPPPEIDNGVLIYRSFQTQAVVGSLAMYECNSGFTISTRNNYVQCTASATWTDAPTCEREISCGLAPTVVNGRISGKTYSGEEGGRDDQVFYACQSGFTLAQGPSSVRCENGKWSVLPRCITQSASCGQLPAVANTRIVFRSQKGSVPMEGDVIWLACTAGFQIQGSEVITCLSNSTWSTLPTCIPSSATCGTPPSVSNAIIYEKSYSEGQAASAGDYIRYRCNNGFTMSVANDAATCSATGQWSDVPQCRTTVDGCGSAPSVENSRVTFTSIVGGGDRAVTNDIVWFECLNGFELEGSSAVRCLASGSWTPAPRCKYLLSDSCGAPPPVAKGYISQPYHGPSITGSTVVYACSTGYKLFGNNKVTCLETGKWSPAPRCESLSSQVTCGSAPVIANGRSIEANFNGNASDVTSYVMFACSSGYVLKGSTRIECLGTGDWTQAPRCEPRPVDGPTCGPVPTIKNAVVVYNTVPPNSNFSIVGDIVWYQCLEGYQPSSYPGIQCASNGWTGQPQCSPIKRYTCSPSMSLIFALDLQETDGFTRSELDNIVAFLKNVPANFHKLTDRKDTPTPDTVAFSTGAATLTSLTSAREYVSTSVTVSDSSNNDATLAAWNQWIDNNVAGFKHVLNDDLAKLLQTVRTSVIPTLPLPIQSYNTSLRIVYLTTATRGTSLIEAQGEATALQMFGGRIFVFAVGSALSPLPQQTALRQQVSTEVTYFRYFATAKLLTIDSLASDSNFQNYFCGPAPSN